jgi:ligand-binding sensor domain-containing protein/two-component sensor histidine kinase
MHKRVRWLVWIIQFINFGQTLHGQTQPFTNYTIQDGLPQSTVYCLFQDREGYLWAGTQGGACSFDGRHFQVWDSQLGLPDNHVTSITQGEDGTIWFGHLSGALSYWRDQKIQLFRSAHFRNSSVINSMVWKDKRLYLATGGNGLYCIQPGKEAVVTHITSRTGLTSDTLNEIAVRNNHQLWLAGSQGLLAWDTDRNQLVPLPGLRSLTEPVQSLCQLPDSTLWYGTTTGAVHVDPRKQPGKMQRIAQTEGLVNTNVLHVRADRQGNIWLATEGGIARISGASVRCFTKANGLLSDLTYQLLEDREGNVWVSQDDGISYYRDSRFELYTRQDGLAHPEVYSIQEVSPGTFWIGTAEGISIFKPAAPSSEQFRSLTTRQGLPGNFIYKIFVDSRHNIWVGTIDHGAACFLTAENRLITFDERQGLVGKNVVGIAEDRKGRIWLATLDGGVAMYQYPTRTMRSYLAGKGFVSNSLWTIHQDNRKQLWFGTKDQGLVRLNEDTDTFEIVPGQERLASRNFGSISSDSRGNIWIGSIGGGVYQYDGRTFRQYGIRQGMKSNNPYFIWCDRNDRIWLGNNVGVDRFDPVSKTTVHYGKKEGFIGIETNQNAVYEDRRGDLWIGTVNGLMHAHLDLKTKPVVPPMVHLLRQRLFFKKTDVQAGQPLSYDQNYLTFDYLGISLAFPHKVGYRYRLLGLNSQWSPLLKESQVSYPNLPPGAYTFQVKAGFEEGPWSAPASFAFVIDLPFWKTWWFRLLAFSVLVSVVTLAYQYRVRQLLRLERMRNKIALDLHDDIGSALSSISIFSEVASKQLEQQMPQETTREIVHKIGTHARAMLDAMDDIVWAVNPKNDHFEDLSIRMREYVIPLLEARNIAFEIDIPDQLLEGRLSMDIRKNIYFVFKEAVNNLLKHADCTRVWMTVRKNGNELELLIRDNGKGFASSQSSRRNGLKNMQSRASEIGGSLTINAREGKGTQVQLIAPII